MAAPVLTTPEQPERTTAAAVHIGAIFFPIWVPVIAWVVARKERPFVAAHARQSLVETIVLNVLIGIAMVASFAYTVWRVWTMYQEGFRDVDWGAVALETAVRFGIWLVAMFLLWAINLVVSVRQAMQALRGEWPRSERKKLARSGQAAG